jgi:hypothetical protein
MAKTTRTTSQLSFHTDRRPLERTTQEFVDGTTVCSSKINELTVGAAGATLVAMHPKPTGKPVTLSQTIVAQVGPKGFVGLHLVRPPGIPNRLPVIMLFHGGGWALGDASLNNVRPPPPADRCRDQCAWAFVRVGARECASSYLGTRARATLGGEFFASGLLTPTYGQSETCVEWRGAARRA